MAISFQQENITMEELLNQSNFNVTNVKPGQIVVGKVLGFHPEENPDSIIMGMSSKSEGRILLCEFDEKPAIGADVEALVQSIDKESGLVLLSKKRLAQQRGWDIILEAFEKNIPVTATVKRALKQGYLVNTESVPMFLPHSHVGNLGNQRGKKNDIIASVFTVRILELNQKRKTGVVSRKVFQNEQNEQLWSELLDNVNIGDIVQGKILKHTQMGAIVEIHGINGFLHRSNISWERNNSNFKDKLPLESHVKVRVLEIDAENHRLTLGLKQLTEYPWSTVLDKVNIGDTVKGKVSFVAKYGAFIDLGNGLEGLLHVSEMSWTRKINHAQEIVKVDEEVETKVIGINAEDKRISLSLRQLIQNPWDMIRTQYKVGQKITGVIKEVTNFGVFVGVTKDIDALIRKEDLSWGDTPDPRKAFQKGQEIKCKVIEINFDDRKIGCSIRHTLPNPYRQLKSDYPRGTMVEGEVTGVVDFGIFVRFAETYEGLVHLSAMTKEQSAGHKKLFKRGDKVKVVVRNVDPENRKISLSLRDVEYAMERIEMAQYINKESDEKPTTSNPFSNLKNVFPDKV